MMRFFVQWWVNVIALLFVVLMVPGIHVDKFITALLAALCLGFVNAVIRPLLIAFTLPLNILSLGLFSLIINGALFLGVSKIIAGFTVMSFGTAVWGALAFSIFRFILNMLVCPSCGVEARFYHRQNRPQNTTGRNRGEVIDIEGKVDNGNTNRKPLPKG